MSERTKARKRAMDVLYSSLLLDRELFDGFELAIEDARKHPERSGWEYASEIIEGILMNEQRIDDTIDTYSVNWTTERIKPLVLAILRIATWELSYTEVPTAVVIDEAVEAAKTYVDEESAAFVNGILGQIASGARPSD
ncbi:MAG: transcription antitermination factor NusB [Microbacteriaceae bacterium]|nr:transcription antitermination factor NusB [Microbacteriaceae bacterium]